MQVSTNRPTVSITGDGGYKIDNDGNVTELTVAEANALYQTMRRERMRVAVRLALEEEYGEEVERSLPEATVDFLTEQYESRYFDLNDIVADNAPAFVSGFGNLIIEALGNTPAKVISIITAGETSYFIRQYGTGDFSLDEKTGKTIAHGDFDVVMGQVEQLFKGLSDSNEEPEDYEKPVDVLVGRIFVGGGSYLLVKTGKEFSFAKEGSSFSLRDTFEEVVAKISEQIASAADLESPESKEAKFLAKIKALWAEFTRVKAEGTDFFYASDLFEVVVRDLVNLVKGMGVYERELFGSRMAPIEKSPLLRFNYSDLANQALDTDWGDGAARDVVADAIEGAFAAELDVAMATLSELYQCRTGRRLGDE